MSKITDWLGVTGDFSIKGAALFSGSQSSTLGTITGVDIDLGTGIYFPYAMSGDATFTLSNIPAGFCRFCLRITYTSGTATWTNFTNLKWDGGAAPSFEASHIYDIIFTTDDAGSNWTGQLAGDFS